MRYLDSEELGAVLKGATITGVAVLPNGRDVALITTAGVVEMTNEMTYKFYFESEDGIHHSETRTTERPPEAGVVTGWSPENGC